MNGKEFDKCKIYGKLRWKGSAKILPKGTLVEVIVKYMNHRSDDFAGHEYVGKVAQASGKGSKTNIEFRLRDVEAVVQPLDKKIKHMTKAQFKKCKVGDKLHWIGIPGMYNTPFGKEFTIHTIYTSNVNSRSNEVCLGRGMVELYNENTTPKFTTYYIDFRLQDIALPTKQLKIDGKLKLDPKKPVINTERIKVKSQLAKCPCCGSSSVLVISPPTVKCGNGSCGLQVTNTTWKKAIYVWNKRVHHPLPLPDLALEPELKKGEKRITINEDKFYKLGEPMHEEVFAGHILADATPCYWDTLTQKWIE